MAKESEKTTEKYLAKMVKKAGGKCYKWTGTVGCPDRICLFPNNVVVFVETKSEGDTLEPQQKLRHAEMKKVTNQIFVVDTKQAIDTLINQLYKEELICT